MTNQPENDWDIRVVDGTETPLVLTIHDDGTPSLFTTMHPMMVVDALLAVCRGIISGDLEPENQKPHDMDTPIVSYTETVTAGVSTIVCDLCGLQTSKEIAHQLDHEAGRALPQTQPYRRTS